MKRTNRRGRAGAAWLRLCVAGGAALFGVAGTFDAPFVAAQDRGPEAAARSDRGGRWDARWNGDAAPGGWGRRGGPAPNGQGGQPGGQGGQNGERNRENERVPLEQALERAEPTKPTRLNQSEFTTQDGVRLVCNYYKGGGNADAPAAILLHGRDGKKEDLDPLAKFLAEQGCAVIVPDLRGCGESVRRAVNDMSRGPRGMMQAREYSMKNFTNDDLRSMIEYDKEVWFGFLIYLHNKELLNAKKTILVGAELGAALAAAWARDDWNGKGDAAQNVVGLALLSPDASNDEGKFNALTSLEAYRKKAKGKNSGFVVFVGQMTEDKFEDAKKIQKKVGGKADEELPPEEKVAPIVALKTEKQGVALLTVESFGVSKTVAEFVANRMNALPKKRQKWEEIKVD